MKDVSLSIVMSVHNGVPYVQQAVTSILKQSFGEFECIIIDDASEDGTGDILSDIALNDERVIVLTNATRLGLTASLNVALAHCHGVYIARMDADDISAKERLEKQYAFMQAHSNVAVCGTQGIYIDEEGVEIGNKNLPLSSEKIKKKLLFNNQCIHSSLFFRRAILTSLGGYNEKFRTSQDYELLLRIATTNNIVNLPERLVYWRIDKRSISWSSKRQEWDGIRARWEAITELGYPFFIGLFHIVFRIGWVCIPQRWKRRRYEVMGNG